MGGPRHCFVAPLRMCVASFIWRCFCLNMDTFRRLDCPFLRHPRKRQYRWESDDAIFRRRMVLGTTKTVNDTVISRCVLGVYYLRKNRTVTILRVMESIGQRSKDCSRVRFFPFSSMFESYILHNLILSSIMVDRFR